MAFRHDFECFKLHINSSLSFAQKVLLDPVHPLSPFLSRCSSCSTICASYVTKHSRTSAYHDSIVPFLARLLIHSAIEFNSFSKQYSDAYLTRAIIENVSGSDAENFSGNKAYSLSLSISLMKHARA